MIKSLLSGFKLAFFLKTDAKDFTVSYASLWFILLIHAQVAFSGDYLYAQSPVIFNYYGLCNEGFVFASFLLAGFIISLFFGNTPLQLSAPVLALNGLMAPFMLARLGMPILPAWLEGRHDYRDLCNLLYLWSFVIFFRTMLLLSDVQAFRQIAGALLLMGALYLPTHYFYQEPFWHQDYAAVREKEKSVSIDAEEVLEHQFERVDSALNKIASRKGGRNLFMVAFAGDGEQDLFLKEATLATKVIGDKYEQDHAIGLINNSATYKDTPLATATNLERTIKALGEKARPEEDALLLFLTSHGNKNGDIYVEMGDLELNPLSPDRVKSILAKSRFKWKIIIVSACYSGKFIEALKDDNTLIITSSRADRTSFGCGEDSELTYFGDAYFKQALAKTNDLILAFYEAQKIIAKKENNEKAEKHSEPQIYIGSAIQKYLGKHW